MSDIARASRKAAVGRPEPGPPSRPAKAGVQLPACQRNSRVTPGVGRALVIESRGTGLTNVKVVIELALLRKASHILCNNGGTNERTVAKLQESCSV